MSYISFMQKKEVNFFITIFLLLPLLTGTLNSIQTCEKDSFFQERFERLRPMECCSSNAAMCPMCLSSYSVVSYFPKDAGLYRPVFPSAFILLELNMLSDQGIVKAIYHPPTSIL